MHRRQGYRRQGGTAPLLPVSWLLLLGGLVLGAPIDLALLVPAAERWLIACGVLALLLMASWLPRALRRCRPDEARMLAALTLSSALALLIGAPALPGERVLLPAGVGAAAVTAGGTSKDGGGWRRWARRCWC